MTAQERRTITLAATGRTDSRLSRELSAGHFVITGEISPPAGTQYEKMQESIHVLGPYCTALNVTDNQGARLHLSSLAASKVIHDSGYEPILQQTCRDRNRLALQSDLLAAHTMGIRDVLLVTGDAPIFGDHPQTRPVYDLDSTQLIQMAVGLNEGHAMNGRPIEGSTDFFIGAVCFPETEPWDIQKARCFQKVEAGARFFQTQSIFEVEKTVARIEEIKESGAKVIASVLLLKSPKVIDFIDRHIAGMQVPASIADRIRMATDPLQESIALAIEQMEVLKEVADGIHVMPLGADQYIPQMLKGAGLA